MQLLFLLMLKLISHVNTQINIAKAVAIRAPQLPSIGNDNKQKLPNDNNTYDKEKNPDIIIVN
jgi:hypothetical protein